MDARHAPRLVKDGDSEWNASAVPVGSSFARLATLASVLSMAFFSGAVVVVVDAGDGALSCTGGGVVPRMGMGLGAAEAELSSIKGL